MQELPPNTLKSKLVHLDHSLKDIERKRFAGIQRAPGSLPVLEAFQDFLDAERAKARRQMTALTAVFILILLVITVGGGALVYFQTQRSAADYSSISSKTETLAKASKQMDGNFKELHSQLEKAVAGQNAIIAAQSNVNTKLSDTTGTVAELQKKLNKLQNENQALRSELEKVNKNSVAAATKIKELEKWQKALARRILKHNKPNTGAVVNKTSSGTVAAGNPVLATATKKRKPHVSKTARPSETSHPRKIADVAQAGAKKKPIQVQKPDATIAHSKPTGLTANRGKPVSKPDDSSGIKLTIKPIGSPMGIRWRLPPVSQE